MAAPLIMGSLAQTVSAPFALMLCGLVTAVATAILGLPVTRGLQRAAQATGGR